jgi:N-acetylneuraminate synthase
MHFEKNLEDFSSLPSDSVQLTLKKVTELKSRIVMIVDRNQHLVGVVSNGDILRWLTKFESPNLASPISDVMNRNFTFVTGDSTTEEIKHKLQLVNYLPQINDRNQLQAILSNSNSNHFKIGKTIIGINSPCYIIAEIGINHKGSLHKAKQLIRHASECEVNAVKVQVRDLNATYNSTIPEDSLKAEHGTKYIFENPKFS